MSSSIGNDSSQYIQKIIQMVQITNQYQPVLSYINQKTMAILLITGDFHRDHPLTNHPMGSPALSLISTSCWDVRTDCWSSPRRSRDEDRRASSPRVDEGTKIIGKHIGKPHVLGKCPVKLALETFSYHSFPSKCPIGILSL